jgi:hypothetical protein
MGGEKRLDEFVAKGLGDGLHGQPDRVVPARERAQILRAQCERDQKQHTHTTHDIAYEARCTCRRK